MFKHIASIENKSKMKVKKCGRLEEDEQFSNLKGKLCFCCHVDEMTIQTPN